MLDNWFFLLNFDIPNNAKTSKAMKIQHDLTLFTDDNGTTGFAPSHTVDKNFNAFYQGQTIFHDIFEHWFEDQHKNFMGRNAFNIGGEVAAMGALAYYVEGFHLPERSLSKYRSIDESTLVFSTQYMIEEAATEEYSQFADEDLITIPYQKNFNNYLLDSTIAEHKYKLSKFKEEHKESFTDGFGKSVKDWKLVRLYRWGFKAAKKMIPETGHNEDQLNEFISFWNKFCKNVDAEELKNFVRSLEINVYTGSKMRWTAFFITHEGERINVKKIRDIEDFYSFYAEEDEY